MSAIAVEAMTESATLESFRSYLEFSGKAASTITAYVRDVKAWLEWPFNDVEEWFHALPKCSPSRTNVRRAALKRWAKHARDDALLAALEYIEAPKKRRGKPRPIENWRQKLRDCPEPQIKHIAIVFFETGLRLSEGLSLSFDGEIPKDWIIKGKGSKERTVFFNPLCRAALTALGGRFGLSGRTIEQRFRRYFGGTPHQARHTFAMSYLANGGSMEILAELLGHSSTAVTRVYGAYPIERLREESERRRPFNDVPEEPTAPPPPAAGLEERFWSKVDRRGPEECWLWLAHIDSAGYGQFHIKNVCRGAHRAAWYLTYGSLPDKGLELDHLCRTTACVNPAHLEPVTHRENHARGSRANQTHCWRGHAFGRDIKNGNSHSTTKDRSARGGADNS